LRNRLTKKEEAKHQSRFSAYIFGRAAKDKDPLKVDYMFEQMTKVRESVHFT
jgi:hypothetical protein